MNLNRTPEAAQTFLKDELVKIKAAIARLEKALSAWPKDSPVGVVSLSEYADIGPGYTDRISSRLEGLALRAEGSLSKEKARVPAGTVKAQPAVTHVTQVVQPVPAKSDATLKARSIAAWRPNAQQQAERIRQDKATLYTRANADGLPPTYPGYPAYGYPVAGAPPLFGEGHTTENPLPLAETARVEGKVPDNIALRAPGARYSFVPQAGETQKQASARRKTESAAYRVSRKAAARATKAPRVKSTEATRTRAKAQVAADKAAAKKAADA